MEGCGSVWCWKGDFVGWVLVRGVFLKDSVFLVGGGGDVGMMRGKFYR